MACLIRRPHDGQPPSIINQRKSIAERARAAGQVQDAACHLLVHTKVPGRDESRVTGVLFLGVAGPNDAGGELGGEHWYWLADFPSSASPSPNVEKDIMNDLK